jgi:hypothetical protein
VREELGASYDIASEVVLPLLFRSTTFKVAEYAEDDFCGFLYLLRCFQEV